MIEDIKPTHKPVRPSVRLLKNKKTSPYISTTFIAQLPTIFAMLIAETVAQYTLSGYSVLVIVLLASMLYVSLRSGLAQGILSSLIIVGYNFHLVADRTGYDLFEYGTLERGGVIAVVFPLLAYIIGRLKGRNDSLLEREKIARIQAEESVRQFQFMAESMPQKIFTTLPDGSSDYMSPQWDEYVSGHTAKEKTASWLKVVHPEDYDENERLWKHSLSTGEPFQFEHRLKKKDGQYAWHLTRARPLRDNNEKIRLWVGSSTDIEDVRKTKKLEADTARLTRQRFQLMELNTAKDEFISLASHQLRTPATGVKQYLNMALDGYGGPVDGNLKMFLEKANDSNERQLSVINDLLQVAQVDAGKVVLRKEKLNLNHLITNIIQEQSSKFARRKQSVTFDEQRKSITVVADPTKLRMVVENIIDNSSKYSPDGSKITIRTMSSRGKVRISVADKGVGIDKKDINKIFQKFKRLDNSLSTVVGGTGIGLYWVKKIIDLHDGEITVLSELGKGSTFTISLPTGDK